MYYHFLQNIPQFNHISSCTLYKSIGAFFDVLKKVINNNIINYYMIKFEIMCFLHDVEEF